MKLKRKGESDISQTTFLGKIKAYQRIENQLNELHILQNKLDREISSPCNFRYVLYCLIHEEGLDEITFAKKIGSSIGDIENFLENGKLSKDLYKNILNYFEIESLSAWENYYVIN